MNGKRIYIAIDLKSFYASVECHAHGFDPLRTNLVVADVSRTDKTICLAVSPSLKAYGIPGRARLFEVLEKVRLVNIERKRQNGGKPFTGKSVDDTALKADPGLELDFVAAPPRMADYIAVSTRIVNIYLQFVAPEDIHVYSIDEVFIDVTGYLNTYGWTPREMAMNMIRKVLEETGITATAGIGTNLYLCKIAMDIVAKHIPADKDGVRIAELDELSYRKLLWNHRPLTDFWRIGKGTARRLQRAGIYTQGDIARCSVENEDYLYRLFGINAELLIDHAWGYEPVTLKEIKAYRPKNTSLSHGQVLTCPYDYTDCRLIIREMADLAALDLVSKRLTAGQVVLMIGYDVDNLRDTERAKHYHGPVVMDGFHRMVPKPAHGSLRLERQTSSGRLITKALLEIYDSVADRSLLIRRINITLTALAGENEEAKRVYDMDDRLVSGSWEQMDLFTDYEKRDREEQALQRALSREKRLQQAALELKKKFGKNAVLKGMNLEKGGTTVLRNQQIGGHKA